MNVWKNHKLSFLLVAGSMMLLLLFQVFWLNNIYQNEKDDLRKKADLIFEDAVRSIEDSLFQTIILNASGVQMAKDAKIKIKIMETSDDHSYDHFSEIKDEMKIFNSDTLVEFNINMRSDFQKKSNEKKFGSVVMWMATDSLFSCDNDSLFNPIAKQNLLENKLNYLIPKSGLPNPYELIILENEKLPEGDLYSNPHLNILSQERFVIFFPNYKNYIFQKTLPQFLFSIFLFGVMFLSFFMIWKSLEKQHRLTELKNDFISNITHELKTPITTVGVALEALSNFNALQNPARTEEYLNISKHELQRLSILVDKVLKMSLFEKKEPELKLESFDMNELIENVLRSMKLQFEKFSANVNFQSEGVNFFIKGDKIHLTNVVYNLIDNALKYSKEKPVIELLLKNKNNQLQLVVKDQGIGISHDLKNKIFEKFFRVPQGNLHDVKGYGLGLSYVSGVIKKHQGEIQVSSQINEGTSFIISLPTNYE